MCSPSCSAVCSSQAGCHAPGSNASSFAVTAFSAPACRLDAGSSLGGWCSADAEKATAAKPEALEPGAYGEAGSRHERPLQGKARNGVNILL